MGMKFYLIKKNEMTVKELINRLKEFNEDYEIEIQYYNVDWCQQNSRPSIDNNIDIYQDEDEDWYTNRVIIDLWDF